VIAAPATAARPKAPTLAGGTFATKLNLALAAGLALPLLGCLATHPGARDAQALQALTLAYCLLPCALKLLAAWRCTSPSSDTGTA
jgi:GPH family glycoside/pentoside/hexuronide:cation symporter